MSGSEIIWAVIINTLFCLSIRTLMMENKPLHFLRKPLENKKKVAWYWFPLVWCVICFASFWGSICFITLNGIMIREMIIACISSTFLLKIVSDNVEF